MLMSISRKWIIITVLIAVVMVVVDSVNFWKTSKEQDAIIAAREAELAARIAADPYDYGVDFSFPIHHYQKAETPLGLHFKQVQLEYCMTVW